MNDFIQSTELLAQLIGKLAEWLIPVVMLGTLAGSCLWAWFAKEGK